MNLYDIVYTGLAPYFAIKFLKKYKNLKVACDYVFNRVNSKVSFSISGSKTVLLHGASIGETLSLLPLKQEIENLGGNLNVVLSTATHTAYKLIQSKNGLVGPSPWDRVDRTGYCVKRLDSWVSGADRRPSTAVSEGPTAVSEGPTAVSKGPTAVQNKVLYMPFDFSGSVKDFLNALKPSIILITEQEIWPNLIINARKMGARIFFINFRIKPQKAYFYNLSFYREILKNYIEKFFCVNDETCYKLQEIGVDEPRISKIDNLKLVPYLNRPLPDNSDKSDVVCLLSVHKGEEKDLILICKNLSGKFNLKFLVIPRYINDSHYFLKVFNREFRSAVSNDFEPKVFKNYDLVIINKFGVVSKVLPITKYTVLGGTFTNLGGHNILEPLFYSNKVLVGKYFYNIAREVERGKKFEIVFAKNAVADGENFINYDSKKIYKNCQAFFMNIENPLNVIIDAIKKYL